MSVYEIWSTILAVVAILVSVGSPLVQFLYWRFRKPVVSALPFDGCPLTLCFNESGSYIELKLSLGSERNSCVVRTIESEVTHCGTSRSIGARWTFLKPIHADWMNSGFQQAVLNSATYVHPIKIDAGKLEPLYVEFGRPLDVSQMALLSKRDAIISEKYLPGSWGSSTREDLLSQKEIAECIELFADSCFWTAGDYSLNLRVLYDADQELNRRFRFTVREADEMRLRENARGIVLHQIPLASGELGFVVAPVNVAIDAE